MKLFLDDIRMPPSNDTYVICRSVEDAVVMIQDYYNGRCPEFISFDHDLGENTWSGYDFAKWLVDKDIRENGNFIPENFSYTVHSQNPVGKVNIMAYLENYFEFKEN